MTAAGTDYVDVEDFLLILTDVVDRKAGWPQLVAETDLLSAAVALFAPAATVGCREVYEGVPLKAAVLWLRLLAKSPWARDTGFVAYECVVEFVRRNGYGSFEPSRDDEADILQRLADGMTETELANWIGQRLGGVRE